MAPSDETVLLLRAILVKKWCPRALVSTIGRSDAFLPMLSMATLITMARYVITEEEIHSFSLSHSLSLSPCRRFK